MASRSAPGVGSELGSSLINYPVGRRVGEIIRELVWHRIANLDNVGSTVALPRPCLQN
jgi:hypothetical protein